MPSSIWRRCGSPVVMPTSQIAATHAGRLLSASIWVFSIKIVSVRIQLCVRMVRSSRSELPTRLKSGCVLVTRGVFVQNSNWVSSILIQVCWATTLLGKVLPSNGQVGPSPQNPYIIVSMYSICGWPWSNSQNGALHFRRRSERPCRNLEYQLRRGQGLQVRAQRAVALARRCGHDPLSHFSLHEIHRARRPRELERVEEDRCRDVIGHIPRHEVRSSRALAHVHVE